MPYGSVVETALEYDEEGEVRRDLLEGDGAQQNEIQVGRDENKCMLRPFSADQRVFIQHAGERGRGMPYMGPV